MQLVLDLGNTKHKYAIYEGNELVRLGSEPQLTAEITANLIDIYGIDQAIVSSVDHFDEALESLLEERTGLLQFTHTTPLPIINLYGTPATLGKDRLAGAVGAHTAFKGSPVLVVDAGTCIKYDFLDKEGIYYGGAISPGLFMRFKAMHNFTARLPLIDPENYATVLEVPLTGTSTVDSLRSGALNGALFEVEGAISAYTGKHAGLAVILTGGDAGFFELHMKSRIFARPNLVLEGLHTILNYNLNH
ncbi:MAG TPA: type III pantothenate kinase [Chitinophagales bacterium]|nr:type III pantothenate kinase [Chitinophagales bacterium]HNK98421.1 type III pantothenate kinase [Chitinophagales bacterium]